MKNDQRNFFIVEWCMEKKKMKNPKNSLMKTNFAFKICLKWIRIELNKFIFFSHCFWRMVPLTESSFKKKNQFLLSPLA